MIREKALHKTSYTEPFAVRILLICITIGIFGLLLIMPLVFTWSEALRKGLGFYFDSLPEPAAFAALQLTLVTAAIVVPVNTVFGLFASWAITKFNFKGKTILAALIDLPFAVSPVVAGFVFVLLLGGRSPIGSWLSDHGLQIIFATPGIVIATLFITFPFVAKELIPLMAAQGTEEEEAALILGAKGFATFWRVTLPNIKWALVYGIVLSCARSIGEFGAVSVVSGHIRGQTNTLPLHVEILFNEYNFTASFAVASLLIVIAVIVLVVKNFLEWLSNREEYRVGRSR